ncbi:MAG TPA: hypothetical protein VK572_15360 [Burkholderiales bacterium]|nr:hypothetical protein [Burkholderiales bacterium]
MRATWNILLFQGVVVFEGRRDAIGGAKWHDSHARSRAQPEKNEKRSRTLLAQRGKNIMAHRKIASYSTAVLAPVSIDRIDADAIREGRPTISR